MVKKIFFALNRLEKTILLGALIVFMTTLSVQASFFVQANTDVVPAQGGQYTEGVVGQPVFINPIIPTTNTDRDIARVVFGSVLDIAESVKYTDDGKTWIVRIRQGIKWHDGEPVTSDDIIFTLNTVQDKESRSPLFTAFQGVAVERVSQLEIKFSLQAPYSFFAEEHLNNLGVIPKHIFGDVPVQNLKLSIFGLKPIGFGPYKVISYDKDDRGIINSYYLESYDGYFAGKPKISKLTFKFYRSEEELVGAYNSGRIDGFGLSSAEKVNLSGNGGDIKIRHTLHDLKTSRYYAIFINQATGGKDIKSKAVREALSRTINRDALIRDVFHSYALPLYGPTPFSNEESEPFDPQILENVELSITVPDEEFLSRTADIVKEAWERAGAKVNLIKLPLNIIQEKILKNTDYEMLMFGNIPGESNDLFSFWHSSRRFYPDQNLSLYQNKKIDTLLEEYRREFNLEKRKETLKTISDTIAADYPAIFLYSPDYVYVSTPSLYGFDDADIINLASDRFENVANWYVKTKRVF